MILPKYPVYIISKGRANKVHGLTARFLAADFVPFKIAIEPQERPAYETYLTSLGVDPAEAILELPFSNLGEGSTPARNYCRETAGVHRTEGRTPQAVRVHPVEGHRRVLRL